MTCRWPPRWRPSTRTSRRVFVIHAGRVGPRAAAAVPGHVDAVVACSDRFAARARALPLEAPVIEAARTDRYGRLSLHEDASRPAKRGRLIVSNYLRGRASPDARRTHGRTPASSASRRALMPSSIVDLGAGTGARGHRRCQGPRGIGGDVRRVVRSTCTTTTAATAGSRPTTTRPSRRTTLGARRPPVRAAAPTSWPTWPTTARRWGLSNHELVPLAPRGATPRDRARGHPSRRVCPRARPGGRDRGGRAAHPRERPRGDSQRRAVAADDCGRGAGCRRGERVGEAERELGDARYLLQTRRVRAGLALGRAAG